MLNSSAIVGRIASDLELKTTNGGKAVLSFSVAVPRDFVPKGEERQSDFISCVAWGNTAVFINKYFSKGKIISILGSLRSRSYEDKNGVKRYVTELYVLQPSFAGENHTEVTPGEQIPDIYTTGYDGIPL